MERGKIEEEKKFNFLVKTINGFNFHSFRLVYGAPSVALCVSILMRVQCACMFRFYDVLLATCLCMFIDTLGAQSGSGERAQP